MRKRSELPVLRGTSKDSRAAITDQNANHTKTRFQVEQSHFSLALRAQIVARVGFTTWESDSQIVSHAQNKARNHPLHPNCYSYRNLPDLSEK